MHNIPTVELEELWADSELNHKTLFSSSFHSSPCTRPSMNPYHRHPSLHQVIISYAPDWWAISKVNQHSSTALTFGILGNFSGLSHIPYGMHTLLHSLQRTMSMTLGRWIFTYISHHAIGYKWHYSLLNQLYLSLCFWFILLVWHGCTGSLQFLQVKYFKLVLCTYQGLLVLFQPCSPSTC